MPDPGQHHRLVRHFNDSTFKAGATFVRKPDQASMHPNAELHGFEPLRTALAIGALLLGLLLGL